jgi:hypothetical protein
MVTFIHSLTITITFPIVGHSASLSLSIAVDVSLGQDGSKAACFVFMVARNSGHSSSPSTFSELSKKDL